MDLKRWSDLGEKLVEGGMATGRGMQAHPFAVAAVLIFLILVWSHFKGDYGPQTLSLAQERPKPLRVLVHVLVMPLRLLASLLSSLVALLVIALVAGFGYVLWRMLQG